MSGFNDGYEGVLHFPGGMGPPVSLRETMEAFEQELPGLDPALLRPIPTGFPNLDSNMGGGLHSEDLVLVVGKQNVGKTLFVSQIARNIALWATEARNRVVCLLICFEHSPLLLQQRLLCMESWLASGDQEGVSLDAIREALTGLAVQSTFADLSAMLLHLPRSALLGWREMEKYLDKLYLYRGDPVYTSPEAIDKMVVLLKRQGLIPVVIVDYLQRVPPPPELAGATREHHIDHVVRSLKSLAMRRGVPVVAIGAVDEQAIRRRGPVHLEDLWGPVTMTYEPDVAWVMNHEQLEVCGARVAERSVRLAKEKNRHGPSEIEWRHTLHGRHFYIQPEGARIALRQSSQIERVRAEGG